MFALPFCCQKSSLKWRPQRTCDGSTPRGEGCKLLATRRRPWMMRHPHSESPRDSTASRVPDRQRRFPGAERIAGDHLSVADGGGVAGTGRPRRHRADDCTAAGAVFSAGRRLRRRSLRTTPHSDRHAPAGGARATLHGVARRCGRIDVQLAADACVDRRHRRNVLRSAARRDVVARRRSADSADSDSRHRPAVRRADDRFRARERYRPHRRADAAGTFGRDVRTRRDSLRDAAGKRTRHRDDAGIRCAKSAWGSRWRCAPSASGPR